VVQSKTTVASMPFTLPPRPRHAKKSPSVAAIATGIADRRSPRHYRSLDNDADESDTMSSHYTDLPFDCTATAAAAANAEFDAMVHDATGGDVLNTSLSTINTTLLENPPTNVIVSTEEMIQYELDGHNQPTTQPEDPVNAATLTRTTTAEEYPTTVTTRWADRHRLQNEITANNNTNDVVNTTCPTDCESSGPDCETPANSNAASSALCTNENKNNDNDNENNSIVPSPPDYRQGCNRGCVESVTCINNNNNHYNNNHSSWTTTRNYHKNSLLQLQPTSETVKPFAHETPIVTSTRSTKTGRCSLWVFWIGIILVALAFAGGAFVAVYFYKRKNPTNSTRSTSSNANAAVLEEDSTLPMNDDEDDQDNDVTLDILVSSIVQLSQTPTKSPTSVPTYRPSNRPSVRESQVPSVVPTSVPSSPPTAAPSNTPTNDPSNTPTISPSSTPTIRPSNIPTIDHSGIPTTSPSSSPTTGPSNSPTTGLSSSPTSNPSIIPTSSPSTTTPTFAPSTLPTIGSTSAPSEFPTADSSLAPSESNLPSYSPTREPITIGESTFFEYLQHVVFDPSVLLDLSTPQGRAMEWLERTDVFDLNIIYYNDKTETPDDFERILNELYQRFAMVVLDFALHGETIDEPQWSFPKLHVCLFTGVTCNASTREIDSINYARQNLTGTVPSELGLLTTLTTLDLAQNQLMGTLDPLYELANVKEIYIFENKLTGPIKESIQACKNLVRFMAGHNQLTGTLPAINLLNLREYLLSCCIARICFDF